MSSYDPRFRRRLALQEGAYRLALGLNPYGAGAAHAPPLLFFLYAKAVPATSAAMGADRVVRDPHPHAHARGLHLLQ